MNLCAGDFRFSLVQSSNLNTRFESTSGASQMPREVYKAESKELPGLRKTWRVDLEVY
jgi:hypothetical protein